MMQDPNAVAAIDALRQRCDRIEKLLLEVIAVSGITLDRLQWNDINQQFAEHVMPLIRQIEHK